MDFLQILRMAARGVPAARLVQIVGSLFQIVAGLMLGARAGFQSNMAILGGLLVAAAQAGPLAEPLPTHDGA